MSARRGLAAAALLGAMISCGRSTDTIVVRSVAPPSTNTATGPITNISDEVRLQIAIDVPRLCARLDGRVYCVTELNPDLPIVSPQNDLGLEHVAGFVASSGTECYWDIAGNAFCTGNNRFGQLGAGVSAETSDDFVPIVGLAHVTRIELSGPYACAILEDQSVRCWGNNESGQTGSDTMYDPNARELVVPTVVAGVKATELALGNSSVVAVGPDGKLIGWGQREYENNKPPDPPNQPPTPLPRLLGLTGIVFGDPGFLGIRAGRVYGWNRAELLLTPYEKPSPPETPVAMLPSLVTVRRVAISGSHGCALLSNGRISSFGRAENGVLGRDVGNAGSYDTVGPGFVEGVPYAVAIAASRNLVCAVTRESEVYCWGSSWGEQGEKSYPRPTRFRLH